MQSPEIQFQCDSTKLMKTIAVFIQLASKYQSKIYLHIADKRANAKSLLGMMSLGVEDGSKLSLSCEGFDQEEAMQTLLNFLKNPQTDLNA